MRERVLCHLWCCDWVVAISPDYHANSNQKGQRRVYQRRPCAARYDLNNTNTLAYLEKDSLLGTWRVFSL